MSDTSRVLAQQPQLADMTLVASDADEYSGVWEQGPFPRGFDLEDYAAHLRGQESPDTTHLVSNHPVVDLFDAEAGHMTSVKSIDPAAASYTDNPRAFEATLDRYATRLQEWHAGRIDGVTYLEEESEQFSRELMIVVPDTGLTHAHAESLGNVIDKYPDLRFSILEVAR